MVRNESLNWLSWKVMGYIDHMWEFKKDPSNSFMRCKKAFEDLLNQ